jgi:hypothetical protein
MGEGNVTSPVPSSHHQLDSHSRVTCSTLAWSMSPCFSLGLLVALLVYTSGPGRVRDGGPRSSADLRPGSAPASDGFHYCSVVVT